MELSDLRKKLDVFLKTQSASTITGIYNEVKRDSLLTQQVANRANASWKTAEYVVAKYDGKDEPVEKHIKGWKELASKINNQYLLLEVSRNTWELYDAQGNKLGDEDFIQDFLKKKKGKINEQIPTKYRQFITAIKTKPFLLLAGISGTGKSQIVRKLAKACWPKGSAERKTLKPRNFEMVQVKPNWHDSTELMGYVSRVSGTAEFVAGDFLKFVERAWEEPDVPYFLCLDEMNLAPVEQYFAEYLSVIESRKAQDEGKIETDPIFKKESEPWYRDLCDKLTGFKPQQSGAAGGDAMTKKDEQPFGRESGNKTKKEQLRDMFYEQGICLPKNLIVVGTVNMDETTFSFSRKVLDRAMTIEMNEFDLKGGLTQEENEIDLEIGKDDLIGTAVEGKDVYANNKDVCDKVLDYLKEVNGKLQGTPFAIAYRTRNDYLLYVVNNLPYSKDDNGNEVVQGYVIARALDEITSMKILSRIEGDETKVTEKWLCELRDTVETELSKLSDEYVNQKDSEGNDILPVSLAKIDEMKGRLVTGYTSFWS